jgi:hypothetical protein
VVGRGVGGWGNDGGSDIRFSGSGPLTPITRVYIRKGMEAKHNEKLTVKTDSGFMVVVTGAGSCPVMIGLGATETEAVEALRSTPVLSLNGGGIDRALSWAKRNGWL